VQTQTSSHSLTLIVAEKGALDKAKGVTLFTTGSQSRYARLGHATRHSLAHLVNLFSLCSDLLFFLYFLFTD
jgi:hypothetical protein